MRKRLLAGIASTALMALTGPVMADSLTPTTFSATIGLSGSTSIDNKLGVISAGPPTAALGDVFFVVDSTGSMGPGITALTNALANTASQLSGLGTFNFGVADYKDQTTNPGDPYNYNQRLNIPGTVAQASTALSAVAAAVGGGGDDPEQGLSALQQAATTTSWDAGAKRIAVIVGDAPSHSSSGHPAATGGANVANTATTLTSNGVTMIALDASGVTGNSSGLNGFGQFSGTGSLLDSGVAGSFGAFTNATDLANQIVADVGTAFATYSDVSLDLIGAAPSCVSVSLPSDITGSFDRSITRDFGFGAVGITAIAGGTCSFTIGLEADGALLATESDTITVTTPEPGSLAVLGFSLAGLGLIQRRRRRN